MAKVRQFRKVECAGCGRMCWTSSHKAQYLCVTCKKARGLNCSGRSGYREGYTTLAVIRIVANFGRCEGCHRENMALVNGKCECCRFYGLGDVDEELSARGRKARSG